MARSKVCCFEARSDTNAALTLSSKISCSKLIRLPSVSGRLEFKLFQPSTRDDRLIKLPISEGNGPGYELNIVFNMNVILYTEKKTSSYTGACI